MNLLIFGLFVVVAFSQIGINVTAGMTVICDRSGRTNSTEEVLNSGTTHSFLDWFLQIFSPKPTTTADTIISTTTPLPEIVDPDTCPSCKCGLTNTQRRIIGGIETKVNQYPWMAQLMYHGRFYCAASVISDRYVLTASHCVHRFKKENIVIRIGDHDRSTTIESVTQDFKVDSFRTHNNYSTNNFNNDIALVKLRGVINFRGSMRPVCLAEKGPTFAGKIGVVTGWGATGEHGMVSNKLLEVSVPIMTNNECRSMRYSANRITENMLCAGYSEGGKDSCQGDSGGPLHVINETGKVHHIVGIVSWGEGCALPNYPGVYTRVNRYLTWIERHTPDACYCK